MGPSRFRPLLDGALKLLVALCLYHRAQCCLTSLVQVCWWRRGQGQHFWGCIHTGSVRGCRPHTHQPAYILPNCSPTWRSPMSSHLPLHVTSFCSHSDHGIPVISNILNKLAIKSGWRLSKRSTVAVGKSKILFGKWNNANKNDARIYQNIWRNMLINIDSILKSE